MSGIDLDIDIGEELLAKEGALVEYLRSLESVVVGYSGGVDSTYLAAVAVEALGRERALAVLGRSPSVDTDLFRRACEVAEQAGVPLLVVDTHELEDPRYAANPANRCYFCKSELWSTLLPLARERGFATVVDGTNAEDVTDYRPGTQAAREREVRSPLADLGFRKAEIRALSRRRGLPTWSQPSSPCLASRLPYGVAVTAERLGQIGEAERRLRALGITGDLRVRHHGDLARIELSTEMLDQWFTESGLRAIRDQVAVVGFARVAIDLRGFRSGSLNVLEGVAA